MKKIWKNKKAGWLIFAAALGVSALAAGVFAWYLTRKNMTAKEAEAVLGAQAQAVRQDAVTKEGSVSVGTKSQVFKMDLSEFTEENVSYSWNMDGAALQLVNRNTGEAVGTDDTRLLEVEEVYVQVGEEITAGTPILKVTSDTLENIRSKLQHDAEEAKTAYEQAVISGKQSKKQAETEQKENQLYGQYADTEYQISVDELSEAAEALEKQLSEIQSSLTETQREKEEIEASIAEQEAALEKASYLAENQDRLEDTYGWLTAVNAKEDIERTIESLTESLETAEDNAEALEAESISLNRELLSAQKELEIGTAEAESARRLRQLNSTNAQEIYDVTAELADFEIQNALEDYESARQRLEDLDVYAPDGIISAEEDGIVTEVPVTAGDGLEEDTELISYNSYSDVTVTLTIEEENMDAAALGRKAEIVVSAFPDEIFIGKVTKIGDVEMNSNTNEANYEVIVTIQENASRLYEGMTASVTFYRDGSAQEEKQ